MKELLKIQNLHVETDDKEILKGVNLEVGKGEIHVIMGPNGAGKSTLAGSIFSNPSLHKTSGKIIFDGQDITTLKTNEVAKRGVFLSFQSPEEISGISVFNFLKTCKAKTQEEPIDLVTMRQEVSENMAKLEILPGMEKRDLNVGFSGGEKKKNEILQLLTLNPKLAILDETDSGLDVDAIKIVSNGIRMFKNENNAVLIITHSTKILEYLDVDYVHILIDGKIVYTGKGDLASQIEKNGYESFKLESKNGKN
jgi:Fe-S cluster assembly ATP-binding protein